MLAIQNIENIFNLNQDPYLAHVDSDSMQIQTIKSHLKNVAELSNENCPLSILQNLIVIIAVLHDAGKCCDDFQKYMKCITELGDKAPKMKVDHTTAGGRIIEKIAPNVLVSKIVSTVVYSHHGEQDCIDLESGKTLSETRSKNNIDFQSVKERYFKICNKEELRKLIKRAHIDTQNLYAGIKNKIEEWGSNQKYGNIDFYLGMYERVLLSLLIDSDWTDTACFSDQESLPKRISISRTHQIWENSINYFEEYMEKLSHGEKSSLNQYRDKIAKLCQHESEQKKTLFRLTVPTGAGKTFSSLRFALYHAKKYAKRHIFYVSPYNSILEQNAKDIRLAVGNDEYVLEHHCNVICENEEKEEAYRKLTENWDCPIVATTAVQLLNTLFSDQKSSIRRMYNLCNSIIIFDEIQAFPVKCTELFHLAVNFLTEFCNTTVILCSATQPSLSEQKENNILPCYEMAGNPNDYIDAFRRVEIEDKTELDCGDLNLDQLCEFTLHAYDQYGTVLVVVNTKSTAENLYNALKHREDNSYSLYHLSTNMCPENRTEQLAEMKSKLGKEHLICISTQLIEAGVNISFGCVIRSLAGLDSIIQAAGRCNRHKELHDMGKVYIVSLAKELEKISNSSMYDLFKAQTACRKLLREFKNEPRIFDNTLDSQKAIKRYYDLYYHELDERSTKYPLSLYSGVADLDVVDLLGSNRVGKKQYADEHSGKLPSIPLNQAFKTAGHYFEVISDDQKISVIVPYDSTAKKQIAVLENQFMPIKEKKRALRILQRYTVGISEIMRKTLNNAIYPVGEGGVLVLSMDYYSKKTGVTKLPQGKAIFY